MSARLTRRTAVTGALGSVIAAMNGWKAFAEEASEIPWSYPIAWPGRALGDGFVIRHGFACENTWYHPGWFHTAEDWYTEGRETGGAGVYAVGAGEVVFVGSDYPGRVVIVKHHEGLFSMYGHLEYEVPVREGQKVRRGDRLGAVYYRTDGITPSHLHFEVRNFLIRDDVNGGNPQHGVRCGFNCAPGPGYWPINAPEHPVDLGWRNPLHSLHLIATAPTAETVIVAEFVGSALELWTDPGDHERAELVQTLQVAPGERLGWLKTATRAADRHDTSALAYRLWYKVETERGERGWVQTARPSMRESGSDGRPSMVELALIPEITAG
ncbi:MAG: M23 family metallopeptidase [Thermomicrobiales bacterium]|nr:M23 family metallopeptidase [Thermomicrobiales bacterium]